jgi:cytohesin
MMAAYWGFCGSASTLLAHGARVNCATPHGETALLKAVAGLYRDALKPSRDESRGIKPSDDNRETIRLLLAHRADPNGGSVDGWTLLTVVSSNGATELARALPAKGAKVNARNPDGTTALHSVRDARRHP